MRFTVTNLNRCAGGGHWHLTVTVGGQSRNITVDADDGKLDTIEDKKEALTHRLVSAAKEANARNLVEIRTAILNKEFEI